MKNIKLDSDGFRIAVSIHEPAHVARTAVILCPGYLDSKDYPHLVTLAEAFANKGLLAVRLDPAGVWESSGRETDYLFSRYLQNIESVRKRVDETYGIKKILVVGHSLGGLAAMVYAAENSVEAVIALCAPVRMTGTADLHWQQNKARLSVRTLATGEGERTFSVPWAFAEDVSQYSAVEAVKTYDSTPLFLLAGSDDTVIPPEEVKTIYEAAHQPKEFVELPIGHDYRKHEEQINFVNKTVAEWVTLLNL